MRSKPRALKKLEQEFYTRDDVVQVARDLLGKVLCSRPDDMVTKAIITETEAYAGVDDRASHAYGGRRTSRTEPMFAEGGIAYVYLCYGIHHLFNVVTGGENNPLAVLVRAGSPMVGVDHMLRRRKKLDVDKTLLAGPGSLARALGIRTQHSGTDLSGDRIWIEDHDIDISNDAIVTGPRIGIDYAGDDAALPYRFVIDQGRLGASR
ncbi:MAG: DNA-3-methyladenine glycosylase [Woeseiaceae bacterium]